MAEYDPASAKKDLGEQLWLAYFNSYLYENGLITRSEKDRMTIEIRKRKPRADRDMTQER